jgi:3-oxoacyl-[acyl-carrier protein] reductase
VDLGIAGRWALVCASSRGLGRACAESLAREGVHVVVTGRTPVDVEAAAAELTAAHGVEAVPVVGDVATPDGRAALLAACPDPDILVTNNGGPPPRAALDADDEAWQGALAGHLLAPLALVRAVVPGMRRRGWGRVVAVSSAMVTTPHPFMALSVGPRTGLAGVLKGLSKEVAADGVTVNLLLPERIDTDRQRQMAGLTAAARGITVEAAYAEIAATIAAGRLGRPEEVGDACAYLCSAQAGFTSGQLLRLDGGSYGGLV